MAPDHDDLSTTVRMRCGKTGAVTHALFTRAWANAKFRVEKVWESTSDGEQLAVQGAGRGSDQYPSNEFDWSGWYCPSCGHYQHGKGQSRFVRCGGCRELVCGFSIREVSPGIRMRKCFCGHDGQISGHIDSYEGQSVAKTNALPADASFKALPPPKHS